MRDLSTNLRVISNRDIRKMQETTKRHFRKKTGTTRLGIFFATLLGAGGVVAIAATIPVSGPALGVVAGTAGLITFGVGAWQLRQWMKHKEEFKKTYAVEDGCEKLMLDLPLFFMKYFEQKGSILLDSNRQPFEIDIGFYYPGCERRDLSRDLDAGRIEIAIKKTMELCKYISKDLLNESRLGNVFAVDIEGPEIELKSEDLQGMTAGGYSTLAAQPASVRAYDDFRPPSASASY